MGLPALIGLGLGAYSAWQGAKQQKRAGDLEGRGLAMSEQQYAERQPFRDRARAGMATEQLPIQSGGLFRDTGNPYSANYADLHGSDMGADLMAQGRTAAGPAPDPMAGKMAELQRLASGTGGSFYDRKVREMIQGQLGQRGGPQTPQSLPPQMAPMPRDRSGLEMEQIMAMLQRGRGGMR